MIWIFGQRISFDLCILAVGPLSHFVVSRDLGSAYVKTSSIGIWGCLPKGVDTAQTIGCR